MRNWNNYKDHVKATDHAAKKDIERIEKLTAIVSSLIADRNELVVSQCNLVDE
ncbi:hypothetical protein [Selenomonas ruminantium]|jgi:1,4-dihydroxy-2-naphthoate octaprenyltransferase|uniref:hypothetical protein n=1 Tax=Selenomonas ruminantium TaxID=971 RepID=UPI0026EAE043|nr:hypothetical protein [Selenomonas ruminantium]